jgi:hypothetical protein
MQVVGMLEAWLNEILARSNDFAKVTPPLPPSCRTRACATPARTVTGSRAPQDFGATDASPGNGPNAISPLTYLALDRKSFEAVGASPELVRVRARVCVCACSSCVCSRAACGGSVTQRD